MTGDLARSAASPDTVASLIVATVQTLATDGTMTVARGDGGVIGSVVRMDSTPTLSIGDSVIVQSDGVGGWVCLGRRMTTMQTTTPAYGQWVIPWTVLPADATPPGSGTVTVSATQAGSWRNDTSSWYTSEPSQGWWTTSSRVYWGAWFYGSGGFDALRGYSCTSLVMHLRRLSGSGINAAVNVHVRLHRNATRPSGPVSWHPASAKSLPGIAVSTSGDITLPTSWGQALIDGTARGIGLYYPSRADYAHFADLSTDSTCGRLTFGWSG